MYRDFSCVFLSKLFLNLRTYIYIIIGLFLYNNSPLLAQHSAPPSVVVPGFSLNVGYNILPKSSFPQTISLKEAFSKALLDNKDIMLANNRLQQRKAQKISSISSLLPKLRAGAGYTRNIPEIKSDLAEQNASQAVLYESVAKLLTRASENEAAAKLQRAADMMQRRSTDGTIIISPKDVVNAKLTLEIPIFNGPDIIRMIKTHEAISLEEARMKQQQAETIYAVAKAYFLASFRFDVLSLKKSSEKTAEERNLKALDQLRHGLIAKKDQLIAEAAFKAKLAESKAAEIEYRSAIGELAIKIGMEEEFNIISPDNLIFETLASSEEALISLAMSNRADLKAQRQAIVLSKKEQTINFMQFFPILSLEGNGMYTSNTKGMVSEPLTYSISLNASLSIFEGGRRFGSMREASLKKDEEEIKLIVLLTEIKSRIRGRKAHLEKLSLDLASKEALMSSAKETALNAKDQYKAGLIEQEDLMSMAQVELDAQIALKKAQSDLMEERLALTHELGLLTPDFVSN